MESDSNVNFFRRRGDATDLMLFQPTAHARVRSNNTIANIV